jgi:hypothetical protein
VAAGVTAIVTAGAAAIAAALVLPGPAAPAAQDTAYVVSHATQALTAVPPGTIFFMQSTITRPGAEVTDMWASYGKMRIERFASGRLVFARGSARTSTTETVVLINYRDRAWSRRASHFGKLSAPAAAPAGAQGSFTCDSANKISIFGVPLNASDLAASLRDWESCGWLKADGTATAGGVTAIRLTMPADGGSTITWYVSPATYLPIRQTTVTRQGTLLSTKDFQWLPPTTANLDLPAVPRGFTRVSGAACNRSPGC